MTRDDSFFTKARVEGRYAEIAETVDKCVFCDLKDKYVVKRNDKGVLTVNIYPYIDGQLIVLPTRHIERYEELTEEEVLAMHGLNLEALRLLREGLGIENVWLILREGELKRSGKTVTHLHWNVMPYKDGLNDWNYQEITIPPLDLANRLRSLDK